MPPYNWFACNQINKMGITIFEISFMFQYQIFIEYSFSIGNNLFIDFPFLMSNRVKSFYVYWDILIFTDDYGHVRFISFSIMFVTLIILYTWCDRMFTTGFWMHRQAKQWSYASWQDNTQTLSEWTALATCVYLLTNAFRGVALIQYAFLVRCTCCR